MGSKRFESMIALLLGSSLLAACGVASSGKESTIDHSPSEEEITIQVPFYTVQEAQVEMFGYCINMQPEDNKNFGYPHVWECQIHRDQTWKVYQLSESEYRIKNEHFSKCLNMRDYGVLTLHDCVDHPDQTWILEPGYFAEQFRIKNKAHSVCLELTNEEMTNHGIINGVWCSDSQNQSWTLMGL